MAIRRMHTLNVEREHGTAVIKSQMKQNLRVWTYIKSIVYYMFDLAKTLSTVKTTISYKKGDT